MAEEIWDLYDVKGNKTGRTWERKRAKEIPEGFYHMVCDILVKHVDGDYLLMQRDPNKQPYPGHYEASAGGSALSGEDPLTCAHRELLEETGIDSHSFRLISNTVSERSKCIFYSYLTEVDCLKDSVILQEGETVAYKWVNRDGLLDYTKSELTIPSHNKRYESYLEELLKENDSTKNGK